MRSRVGPALYWKGLRRRKHRHREGRECGHKAIEMQLIYYAHRSLIVPRVVLHLLGLPAGRVAVHAEGNIIVEGLA